MILDTIFTSRATKYSAKLLLALLISFVYFFCYQENSVYSLHVNTVANHLAVETVTWSVNGAFETKKEATFSVDSNIREHLIPLAIGKYNTFKINCISPNGGKGVECIVKDLYISDISGAMVFSFDKDMVINNEVTLSADVFLNGEISLFAQILQFLLHLAPVYLILLIFYATGLKRGIPLAIGFCVMFIYAMLVFPHVNTGMDAIENVNVAKYLFTKPYYYSYVEYRGYMWFLILWIISYTANLFHLDFYYCYAVYGCLIFTLMLNYILPNFAKNLGIEKISYYSIALLGVSIILLYGKQFFCPLPDIMPIFFLLLGFNLLLSNKINWKLGFLAGICVAVSCLIRANYYLSVLLILIVLVVSLPRKQLIIIAFLMPILLLFISNKIFTMNLPIKINKANLMQEILFKGMMVQKTSPFEIKDMTGIKILEKEQVYSSKQLTFSKYLELIKKYSMDFLTLYSIRVFNGLDIKYSQVYVSEGGNRRVFSLINYILVFSGLYYLYSYFCNRFRWQKLLYILGLTIPSLCMVSSFVETRYFLSLSLILITLGALSINGKLLKNKGFILGLLIFVVSCLTLSMTVYNQIL